VATGVSTTVTIGSISFAGFPSPYTNLSADFNTELLEGHSYTLTVDLKDTELIIAGSNIYWDGTKLTFDGPGASENMQLKQGLFFKWGSLVGISPALTNGSDAYSVDTPVYTPEYNSGSPSWNTTTTYAAWNDIPYVDDNYPVSPAVNADRTEHYLTDNARNTAAQWNAKKGDICRYLSENGFGPGGNWRMPTSADFVVTQASWGLGWWTRLDGAWNDISLTFPTNSDGTTVMAGCGGGKFRNGIFPLSGDRQLGVMPRAEDVGEMGMYWCSTVARGGDVSAASAYTMYLRKDIRSGNLAQVRYAALSVRCVKN
jgi:hypothetical protein